MAIGLLHAHGKGVLHCDLKPANMLLDQDSQPRLADFGQSRLSHEQTPALGTLFYMAPEQADLQAVPDVRWDVYALGALLVLHADRRAAVSQRGGGHRVRNGDRSGRAAGPLSAVDRDVAAADRPSAAFAGVDRELADIVDGCLAPDRERALRQRAGSARRARTRATSAAPGGRLVLLGFVGPALLLAVMSIFAWSSFDTVMDESDDALRQQALESNLVRRQVRGQDGHQRAGSLLSGRRGNGRPALAFRSLLEDGARRSRSSPSCAAS